MTIETLLLYALHNIMPVIIYDGTHNVITHVVRSESWSDVWVASNFVVRSRSLMLEIEKHCSLNNFGILWSTDTKPTGWIVGI